jgi:hypothetical protein
MASCSQCACVPIFFILALLLAAPAASCLQLEAQDNKIVAHAEDIVVDPNNGTDVMHLRAAVLALQETIRQQQQQMKQISAMISLNASSFGCCYGPVNAYDLNQPSLPGCGGFLLSVNNVQTIPIETMPVSRGICVAVLNNSGSLLSLNCFDIESGANVSAFLLQLPWNSLVAMGIVDSAVDADPGSAMLEAQSTISSLFLVTGKRGLWLDRKANCPHTSPLDPPFLFAQAVRTVGT